MSPVIRVPFAFSLCAVVFLLLAPSFAQSTINVPGDQATIQGAINAATNGDTVLVAPGTYFENINFNGKAVTVTSSAGAAQTIIDGGQKGPVVIFSSGEGPHSVLNGFTVQDGTALFSSQYSGAGIYINAASPRITNNVVENNTGCAGTGVGIAVWSASPTIQGNTIKNNSRVGGCSGGYGGGIAVIYSGSAQIISNLIINNSMWNGNGGGIALFGAGTPSVENNLIVGNVASGGSSAQGGGLWLVDTSGIIAQNVIYGNLVSNSNSPQGSGIYLSIAAGGTPALINNTIIGDPSVTLGSAVYAYGTDSGITFYNNILVGPNGQNAVYCDPLNVGYAPVFTNNDAFSNSGTGLAGACSGQGGQNGNISVDPLFVNAASDFHLQPTSLAIDAGTNAAPNLPPTDFGGNPRILDGNNDCVSTVDMGAYELVRSANVSFLTNTLGFASQPLTTSSSPQPVTLSNTGNTCFQFSNIGITGDFSQANTCGAAGVRGGTSCTFNVTFTPAALGTRLGALTVSGSEGVSSASPSVSLSGVGVAPPDFTISASPASVTVRGDAGKSTVTVAISGGFSSAVALLATGQPTGVTVSFTPASIAAPGSGTSNMAMAVALTALNGTYPITVTGTGGGIVHTATVTLIVNHSTTPNFAISAAPTAVSAAQGSSGSSTITSAIFFGFNSAVALSATGQPTGVTVSFTPATIPAPGSGTSNMTMAVAANTAPGTYPITVSGAGGAFKHTITVTLTVTSTGTPDFTISAAPVSVSVVQGNSGSSTVTVAISGGFSSAVALSATGQPTGVTVSFAPPSIAAPGSGTSTMTMAVASNTVTGTYPITVTGSGGGVMHTTTVTLTVNPAPVPDFTISGSPASVTVGLGNSGTSTIGTAVSGGFSSAVALSAIGQPTGVTVSFNPASIAAPSSGNSTMTMTVASTTAPGTYPITVTGSGGAIMHSTTVTLTVTAAAPDFTVTTSPSSVSIPLSSQATMAITINPVNGFAGSVKFSATGVPSGVTTSFNPNPTTTNASTLYFRSTTTAVPGTYTVTIRGSSGSLNRSIAVGLTIQ